MKIAELLVELYCCAKKAEIPNIKEVECLFNKALFGVSVARLLLA